MFLVRIHGTEAQYVRPGEPVATEDTDREKQQTGTQKSFVLYSAGEGLRELGTNSGVFVRDGKGVYMQIKRGTDDKT
jgi:hypothetical protein